MASDELGPWTLLPDVDPENPDAHSIGESYIIIDWLRFWQSLTDDQKAEYLDRHDAPPAWRHGIAAIYEFYPIEVLRDESQSSTPWWRRWFGGGK